MKYLFFNILLFFSSQLFAQKIIYSEPDKDDNRQMKFEIIGKLNANNYIYKASNTNHYINIFDAQMQLLEKVKMEFIPEKILNIDFLAYPDFFWTLYQYQNRNIIYNMAAKIDTDGKIVGKPIKLDSTDSRDVQSGKIYQFVQSANKNFIMFFKVNSYEEKLHKISTFLYDKNLTTLSENYEEVNMKERNSFLTGFEINNNGHLIFFKAIGSSNNDNINQLTLISKPNGVDTFRYINIKKIENVYLDELNVKVENSSNRFIISSLYTNKRRGDIQGLYISIFDGNKEAEILSTITTFEDDFRKDAKADAGMKQAFNNYFIKQIIPKKNGGFLMCAESDYQVSRNINDNWNRWDAFSNPVGFGNSGFYGWGNRWGNNNSFNNTRFYNDNIAIASFDSTGKIEWNNVIFKSQFDDNTNAFSSYGMFNAGNQLKFYYNEQVKQEHLLTEQLINPDGKLTRSATLKNLDKGFDFMPRYAKQVGAKQILIPCMYRNSLCFAKIDY